MSFSKTEYSYTVKCFKKGEEMYKIGLSSCGRIPVEKDFSDFKNGGIGAIEISVALDNCDKIDFKSL